MENVNFSVDASIINRLGLELVTKSETALSELIKNAYDADATKLDLYFTATEDVGGELIILDNGEGMNREQLINGFLRLATTDKINHPVSKKLGREKAGRKGIGRFSAQRLGTKLTIITKTKESEKALRLTINWDDYEKGKTIQSINNTLEEMKPPKQIELGGTILVIKNLREKWTEADIKRVYRYVAELIQPSFLTRSEQGITGDRQSNSFEVVFKRRKNDKEWEVIADPQKMLFEKALATFSGYVDETGRGFYQVQSRNFTIKGKSEKCFLKDSLGEYPLLKGTNLMFKVYYYIGGGRESYYKISKAELNILLEHLGEKGGVKLYRNGFVVAKYGDKGNDWLNIDSTGGKLRLGLPFNNNRVIGFVQVRDVEGRLFEESAGREGLLETLAFKDMQQFASKALEKAFQEFAVWFRTTDEYREANPDRKEVATTSSIEKLISDVKEASKVISKPDATEQNRVDAIKEIEQRIHKLALETRAAINELEMIRVLAGTGLTIAEFIHEIKQFVPSLNGYIHGLIQRNIGDDVTEKLRKMQKVLASFLSYTAYFDATLSQNVVRELKPIDLRDAVRHFQKSIENDLQRRNITFKFEPEGYDLITTPMHPSEWNTILQNLYSNAKKAILKAGVKGEILLQAYKDREKGKLFLSFQDNGIGIKKENQTKIFDAFFTTSKPNNNYSLTGETGMGLGLYIVRQIIKNREGDITVGIPAPNYKTSISIELPLPTPKQLKEHGY